MPSSRGIFLTQGLNPCLSCLLHWHVGSFTTITAWEDFSIWGNQKFRLAYVMTEQLVDTEA